MESLPNYNNSLTSARTKIIGIQKLIDLESYLIQQIEKFQSVGDQENAKAKLIQYSQVRNNRYLLENGLEHAV